MWTHDLIFRLAAEQSAVDFCCAPEDFFRDENVITISCFREGRRADLEPPHVFDLVSYGSNVVACVREDLQEIASSLLARFAPAHCFGAAAIHALDELLLPQGIRVEALSGFFLPCLEGRRIPESPLEIRILEPPDFAWLYRPEWSNALCARRRELDRLCVGAYAGETLVALAGASADSEKLWQIGVDVLPAYRRKGLAKVVTARLAAEVFARGKVPFYGVAWANIPSVRNALACGFVPAWAQLEAKPIRKEESAEV